MIVVAHRASILGIADRIAVMREGRIVDVGERAIILDRLAKANAGGREQGVALGAGAAS